ncbi:MAG: CRISPR-associated endoribonuclease Cas6 [Bacteroidota bacterium]
MRVRIVFSLRNKGAIVPFHHQHLLTQLINDVLSQGGNKFINYELCNFSGLKGQTKVTHAGLCFYSSKITLVLSSPDVKFVDYFLVNLFRLSEVQVGQLLLSPESVVKEEHPFFKEEVKYVCISPIVLLANNQREIDAKRFISPETDQFSDLLYECTMNRMEALGTYSAEQIASYFRFQIVPDKSYLDKIRLEEKKFARIYAAFDDNDEKIEVRGYTFPFTLYAAPDVHRFIFDCGIGELCSKGFGMIDIADEQFHNRISPYRFENGEGPANNVVADTTEGSTDAVFQDKVA